jgi:hypothetical protein
MHSLRYRRFKGHATSVWCSCGWAIPEPARLVMKAQIVARWREHIAA